MVQKSTKWMWALIPMWFQVKRSKLKRSVKIPELDGQGNTIVMRCFYQSNPQSSKKRI